MRIPRITILFALSLLTCCAAGFSQTARDPNLLPNEATEALPGSELEKLNANRRQLELEYSEAEQASIKAAQEYREAARQSPGLNQELVTLKKKLEAAVKHSFDVQTDLRQVRLQIAILELADLQTKQLRRQSLAAKIIERRISDLIEGKDLNWSSAPKPLAAAETNSRPKTKQEADTGASQSTTQRTEPNTNNPAHASASGSELPDEADPELGGQWRLSLVAGPDSIEGFEYRTMRTAVGELNVSDGDKEVKYLRRVDVTADPRTIDVYRLDQKEAQPVRVGIYTVDGNRLKIAWGQNVRPKGFDAADASFTYRRDAAVPKFATPQELFDYMGQCDVKTLDDAVMTFCDLLTNDELKRVTGMALRGGAFFESMSSIAATFGALSADTSNSQLIEFGEHYRDLLKDSRLAKPSRAAKGAFSEITATGLSAFTIMQMVQSNSNGQKPETKTVDVATYSKKLRDAAGTLRDPKQYLCDFVSTMTGTFMTAPDGELIPAWKQMKWDITIDGERATAVPQIAVATTVNGEPAPAVPQPADREMIPKLSTLSIQLVRENETWKISSIVPDEMIIEIQKGITVGSSEKEAPQSDK